MLRFVSTRSAIFVNDHNISRADTMNTVASIAEEQPGSHAGIITRISQDFEQNCWVRFGDLPIELLNRFIHGARLDR
jgi:hypothetical protein